LKITARILPRRPGKIRRDVYCVKWALWRQCI